MDRAVDFLSLAQEVLGRNVQIVQSPKCLNARPPTEVWQLVTSAGSMVIRLGPSHKADAHANRTSEQALITAAAANGLAAKVLLADPERNVLVTEFLGGKPWAARDARTLFNIARIAATLKRLHALAIPGQAVELDLHRILQNYWQALLEQGRSAKAGPSKLRDRMKLLAEKFNSEGQPSVCHFEIHHRNVIDIVGENSDGTRDPAGHELRLVDWQYAGICDPIFDLAGLCCHHEFSAELRAALLKEYFGTDSASVRKRLEDSCLLLNYIRELWFAVREV